MNKLIHLMATDMNIRPYTNESDASFECRVSYSALGLWCLMSTLIEQNDEKGISKIGQTTLLHERIENYAALCPTIKSYLFVQKSADPAVFIRNIYEQTGYLITREDNHNVLNHSGETVRVGDKAHLYLGVPEGDYTVNGLGIHVENAKKDVGIKEYLVRDELTPEEYLIVNFDECDFDDRDIDIDELEFFNPFYYGNFSKSWHKRMKSDITVARKSSIGPYYKVIRKPDGMYLFKNDKNIDDLDALTGAEFRRNYAALKHFYDNPMQLLICPIDEEYTYIRILGQLPNREYYYLLMNAWPKNDFLDRNNFIIRNTLMKQTEAVLGEIGYTARRGDFYG